MRLLKTTRTKNGKKVKSKKWYIHFKDPMQLSHRIAGFENKAASQAYGQNIQRLVDVRLSNQELPPDLSDWLNGLPDKTIKSFVSWGMLDSVRAETSKTVKQHIDDYIEVLKTKKYAADYIRHTKNRLIKIISDCRFIRFRDISQSAFEVYIGRLIKDESKSTTTAGHYIDSLKAFLNWACRDRRITSNPIEFLSKPARNSELKGILTPQQFTLLIKTTYEKNIIVGGISGRERSALYLLAGTTGLRKKELLNLTWADMNLEGCQVKAPHSITKNKRDALLPLTEATAGVLRAYKDSQRAKDTDKLFSFTTRTNTADLIRSDMQAAGLPLFDREGNEIVFHSLRNSFISFLANSQTPAKVVQKMARHSDPKLTFNTYARALPEAEKEAVNSMEKVFTLWFTNCMDFRGIPVEPSRELTGFKAQKTGFLGNAQTPRVGFEPTT